MNSTVPPSRIGWPASLRWLEWEAAILLLLAAAIYVPRMTDLTVRGEESRRARVAVEMIESGDWVVPRQQGELYFSRPPLQNWAIAAIGLLRGQVDSFAIRTPSIVAVLLLALLIYTYSRAFLSRLGAFAAGAVFITMGQVLELGRLGETDILFTLFISGSLLLWHFGRVREWRPVWIWSIAYLLVALGTLTKGPQAPLYFAASIGLYLLITHRWRDAFSWSHVVGIFVFFVAWTPWNYFYYRVVGWEGFCRIYGWNVAVRFKESQPLKVLEHLAVYPLEVWACMLPWSVFLLLYFRRDFRKALGASRSSVGFLVCCILITFPSVWLPVGGRSRYFMPLYPCFALLIGLAVERCWLAEPTIEWQKLWRQFIQFFAVLMPVSALLVLIVNWRAAQSPNPSYSILILVQPYWFTWIYITVMIGLTLLAVWSWNSRKPKQRFVGVLVVALFLGILYEGVVTNILVQSSTSTEQSVARLKQEVLPKGGKLVSLGRTHHLFAYYYRDPIPVFPLEKVDSSSEDDFQYFCMGSDFSSPIDPSFPWEELAVISCDRKRHVKDPRVVVIGRRLPNPPQK